MVFIGDNLLRRRCQHCNSERFEICDLPVDVELFPNAGSYSHLRPKAIYSYLPIIPRLKLLYANPNYASKMKYPQRLNDTPWIEGHTGIRDIWEGNAMKHWKAQGTLSLTVATHEIGYFQDERTVALHFSTDRVQLFRNGTQEVWPFLVLNLNLPPEDRYDTLL